MKLLLAPIFILNLCSLMLVGCDDSIDNLNSSDTDSIETSAQKTDIENKVSAPVGITVRIKTNQITISWSSVELATDYKVYISSTDGDVISAATTGNTHYSLSTNAQETYQIRVTAMFENGLESDFSSRVTVVSKDQQTRLTCNECSP